MKLNQALKLKKRLAGEIVRTNNILQRENARRSDSTSTVDRKAVFDRIIELSNQLLEIKAKIARANVPIYDKIEAMSELKTRIAFIQSLPKREGEEISFVGRDNEKLVYTWNSFINQSQCDALVLETQKTIDSIQDNIDEFNHQTEI